MERFYLGTHQPTWLARTDLAAPGGQEIPLFVSHRRLAARRSLPRARRPWACDSGGFTELSMFGRWRTTPEEYVAAVHRYQAQVGMLDWAAPQDWMCEPAVLARTGLTVEEHQRRTVENLVQLRQLWPGRQRCPIIPVLQGWSTLDYERCTAYYDQAGVDLAAEPLVGVGSICRRQRSGEIRQVLAALGGLRLHGFGVKTQGLRSCADLLSSADSMAWSLSARAEGQSGRRRPGCLHASCVNCPRYATDWYRRVQRVVDHVQLTLPLG